MIRVLFLIGCLALAGCVARTSPGHPAVEIPPVGACDAASTQAMVGKIVSAEMASELLRLTGARELRWIAPGMAVTMDYKFDRLSVSYDERRAITRITCG
jgi:hypothetical protein